jgi:hypothetical protein
VTYKNEEVFAKALPSGFGFNSLWNCQYKNLKMINTEADPPRNFVFWTLPKADVRRRKNCGNDCII